MRKLLSVQLLETSIIKVVVLACFLWGALSVSITSFLSTEVLDELVFEDLLLHVTNNTITVTYTFVILMALLVDGTGVPTLWQSQICLRSGSRGTWLCSLLVAAIAKVTLFIAFICLFIFVVGLHNGAVFASRWDQVHAAPYLINLLPVQVVMISLALVFCRLLFFSLLAILINLVFPKHHCGAIISILASCCIDANYSVLLPFLPIELAPNYHSLIAYSTGTGHWYPRIGFFWSFLYWGICIISVFITTYGILRKRDFILQR